MKRLDSLGLRVDERGRVLVLDQQKLPHEEIWLECQTPREMDHCIRELKVRGAPLIGVAAAVSLARFLEQGASSREFEEAAQLLRKSRPTAVNLMAAVDRILSVPRERVVLEAETIFEEDVRLCEAMAENGAALVKEGESILTHCNSGGLATVGIGTAFGVIRKAHEMGKRIHVYVDETRPLLQGGRLTAWELGKLGIPYTLICDNMAGFLMKQGRIQRIFVGADRVAANGDFANKVGTYSVACLAQFHSVPFHPVAPYTTVDLECPTGAQIPVEERKADEVRGAHGAFGSVIWSPRECAVYNPSFDVTPAKLVESLVLDRKVFSLSELESGALKRVLG